MSIALNRLQVGAMIRFVCLSDPLFFASTGYRPNQLRLMASGYMKLKPAILTTLNLEEQGEVYLWTAR